MPNRCSVKGCYNARWRTKDKSQRVYHTFPKSGDQLRKWLDYCRRDGNWKPNKNFGICSDHFDPTSYDRHFQLRHEYIGAKMRRQLLPGAVPGVVYNTSIESRGLSDSTNHDISDGQNNCGLDITEECYEESMIIEKLEDLDDHVTDELKSEPRSHSPAPSVMPAFSVDILHDFEGENCDIKEEIEEQVELPLPQLEILANPLDIPSENHLINQFCRLCLREIATLFPLLSRIQDVLVPDMFHTVTGVGITFNDKLPRKVCIDCLIRLEYAYNIRKEFLETGRTLNCFSVAKIIPLLEHLQNYQKGIRLTTESYGEKILRQHKDIIQMRLIKKQEEMTKDEVSEMVVSNIPVEEFVDTAAETTNKFQPDQYREMEANPEIIDLEDSIEQVEYLEEESLEDRTVEEVFIEEDTNGSLVKEEEPIVPKQQKEEKRRKCRRYNIELKETKPDPNKCYICGELFDDTDKLHYHLPTHIDMLPYSCEQCIEEGGQAKELNSLVLLHRHFRMHAGSIKCSMCPMRTFTASGLYGHMATYHREDSATKYTCEICGHQMVNSKRFRIHMRFHNALDQGRFSCKYCKKMFATNTRLARHERIHTQERPYKCKYCDKRFTSEPTQHERTHTGEKRFRCDICGKSYQHSKYLSYHINEMHGESNKLKSNECLEEIKCEFDGCDFSTKNRYKYYTHKATHTLNFHCSHCSKRFPTKQRLENHENGHTGLRPFCCDQCGKSFRYKHSFVEHMNGHKNIRPYTCDVCGMAFVRGPHLKEHRLKHSDILKYECRICNKKFKYGADLYKHKRTHTEADTGQTAFQYNIQDDMDLIVEDVEVED